MNQREWKRLCKVDKHLLNWEYYNKTRKLQKSLQFNTNDNATVIHHLRDTEEQRKYNDTYYEFWGFNQDGTFEYGKYVIFLTKEEHNKIHSDSNETRKKKKNASVNYWSDPMNREYHSLISKLWWDEEKRSKLSICYTGEGNPFYGKHHSEETLEKLSGENNGMYGKHHTEEAKRLISEANKGKIVSQETRDKLSKASSGEKNGMYGKKHTEEALEKLKHSRGVILQQQASIAYKEHKENGGTMKWQDFRREFFKLNKK